MTNIQKALITTIAVMSFAAFAQTSGSTSGTSGPSVTNPNPRATSVGASPTGNSMNYVPLTNSDGTSSSTASTGSTTGSGAMARDPAMIRRAQQALIDKGISTGGAVDGFWGTRSTSALREFQRQENLPITGQLDSQSMTALGMSSSDGSSTGNNSSDTAPGMQQRQGRSPADVSDDTAPMDNTTPGTGRSPSDTQR